MQKKQAMLNASKQHHTGKPKGESLLNTETLRALVVAFLFYTAAVLSVSFEGFVFFFIIIF